MHMQARVLCHFVNIVTICLHFGLDAGLITRTGFFRSAPSGFIKIFDWATNDLLGVAETVCPPLPTAELA